MSMSTLGNQVHGAVEERGVFPTLRVINELRTNAKGRDPYHGSGYV